MGMSSVDLNLPDDIENQQAVRLASEADPTGERTIGEMKWLQEFLLA